MLGVLSVAILYGLFDTVINVVWPDPILLPWLYADDEQVR